MDSKLEETVNQILTDKRVESIAYTVIDQYIGGKVEYLVKEFVEQLIQEMSKKIDTKGLVSEEIRTKIQTAVGEKFERTTGSWELNQVIEQEVQKAGPAMVYQALAGVDLIPELREQLKTKVNTYLQSQVSEIVRMELGVINTQLTNAMQLGSQLQNLQSRVMELERKAAH